MLWLALSAAAFALPLLHQQDAQPKLTAEKAAIKARIDALLEEARLAEAAGDKARMFAKSEEAVKLSDNPTAMHALGHMFEKNPGLPGAQDKAFHWFLEAARRGHGEAMSHAAKPLENDAALADAEYSKIVDALAEGVDKNYFSGAASVLSALAKKQAAARTCAVDLAKRLGYAADDTEGMVMGPRASDWYRVRSGNSGDQLAIYGADAGSMFKSARYSRLRVRTSGFTGIKYQKIPLSDGDSMTVKNYTGYRADASPQGKRDAQTILAACRAK